MVFDWWLYERYYYFALSLGHFSFYDNTIEIYRRAHCTFDVLRVRVFIVIRGRYKIFYYYYYYMPWHDVGFCIVAPAEERKKKYTQ